TNGTGGGPLSRPRSARRGASLVAPAAIRSRPMTAHLLAAARPSRRTLATYLVLVVLGSAACSTAEPSPGSPTPTSRAPGSISAAPTPSPIPSPTPAPTPRFTNQPDPQLEALIPATIVGARVQKPTPDEFGVTP